MAIGSEPQEAAVVMTSEASIDTQRPISGILAEWRAAERRLAAAESGSTEALEAEATSDHFRREYRRAHEARRR